MTTKGSCAIVVAVLSVLAALGGAYGLHRRQYPFGVCHRCDKQLWSALREYAEANDGNFPSGEATPEASLGLLGPDYAYLLFRRDGPRREVEKRLARGELLDPETCGWNYIEGLRLDSNSRLALFWDKEGLNEMGGRLPEGGHYVSYVGWPYEYVPASQWDDFLEQQRELLAQEKARRRNDE